MSTLSPFHRWVGGKRWLLPQLDEVIPEDWSGRYIAPFLGGGALFWHLKSTGRLQGEVVLNDANPVLVGCWRNLRDWRGVLLTLLEGMLVPYNEANEEKRQALYDGFREMFNVLIGRQDLFSPGGPKPMSLDASALFLFLNKTSFNGLYRLNQSRGHFNVARDDSKKADGSQRMFRLNVEQLEECSEALQGVDIRCGDACKIEAGPGDLVYADPPYLGTFGAYTGCPFREGDQVRLAEHLTTLRRRGACVITSNSDHERIPKLYPVEQGWTHRRVHRPGTVSSDPTKRGRVTELLMVATPFTHRGN